MSCEHDCKAPPNFPKQIFNRAGLNDIQYRIGTYSLMREAQLHALNNESLLEAWTHREADDPAIALIEANAIVADILSLYQQSYANEAYIRTARWRESIMDLVQLSGYRLAPGVAGEATFCVAIKGDNAVSIPAGTGFKAKLAGRTQEDKFESVKAHTAYPALSAFHFYRVPKSPVSITAGLTQLELQSVDGVGGQQSLDAVDLQPGDQLMLVSNADMYDVASHPYSAQTKSEIIKIQSLEHRPQRLIVHLEGAVQIPRGASISAFKVGRQFKHFAHNASRRFSIFDDAAGTVSMSATNYERNCYGDTGDSDYYSGFRAVDMPIDGTANDLAIGSQILCRGVMTFDDSTTAGNPERQDQHFTVVKTLVDVQSDNVIWGNMEASVSILQLDSRLVVNPSLWFEKIDIRRTECFEVLGPTFTLGAPLVFEDGSFVDGDVHFYGTYHQAQQLIDRTILLSHQQTKSTQQVRVNTTLAMLAAQLVGKDEAQAWRWVITLDQLPDFPQQDFDDEAPQVQAYGNVIPCTQGITEKEVVLGSGDQRQTFQTFALPKAPLTYLLDSDSTPAQQAELTVYVDGMIWTPVTTLYGRARDAQVYVVRQDAQGNSYIQFGDNKMGAKLPSGQKNVRAVYRTGIGATGALEADIKPGALSKVDQLGDVFLPKDVVGGAEAESEEAAREAAPARMQSLGRIVGLADLEAEALMLPGVLKTKAIWAAPQGSALVQVVVLTESQSADALAYVQDTLNTFNRCRGAKRHPIQAIQGVLQYIYVNLRVGVKAERKLEDIESDIRAALGVIDEASAEALTMPASGCLSLAQRAFGQDLHWSHILHAVQSVQSVLWVEIDAAQKCELGSPPQTDPLLIASPTVFSASKRIRCRNTHVLVLHERHFQLNLIGESSSQECA